MATTEAITSDRMNFSMQTSCSINELNKIVNVRNVSPADRFPVGRAQRLHLLFMFLFLACDCPIRGVFWEQFVMRKFVLAAAVLAMAGTTLPSVASARSGHKDHMMMKHHRHCHMVKKKVRVNHHWVWRNVKVCR